MKYYFDWLDANRKEYNKKDGLRRYPLFARLGCFIAIIGILVFVSFYSYLLLNNTPTVIGISIAVFILGLLMVIISLYLEEFKKRR